MSYKLFESLKVKKEENKIKVDDIICDFYQSILNNDLSKAKEIYNKLISNSSEKEINDSNDQYLHQVTGICSEYGYISILEWLHYDLKFNIDSFQMFLIACENSRIDVIKWGIDNDFEILPQHILHAVRNGQLSVLQYMIENTFEEDIELFFTEPFIRNAIECEQYEIIEYYQQNGVDIEKYLEQFNTESIAEEEINTESIAKEENEEQN